MWPCYANDSDILLESDIMEVNLQTISDLLLSSDKKYLYENINLNFTNEYLETAAKMFIYWNLCPSLC